MEWTRGKWCLWEFRRGSYHDDRNEEICCHFTQHLYTVSYGKLIIFLDVGQLPSLSWNPQLLYDYNIGDGPVVR